MQKGDIVQLKENEDKKGVIGHSITLCADKRFFVDKHRVSRVDENRNMIPGIPQYDYQTSLHVWQAGFYPRIMVLGMGRL